MLQNRLDKIKDYFQSIERYDGKWLVCVRYNPKWGAYDSEDKLVKAAADEKQPDIWWYYATNPNVDIEKIFDLIEETIQTNLDAIKKAELFKLKANELKQLFSNEKISFKQLQTLKFVFDEPETSTEKPKRRGGRTKPTTKKSILDSVVNQSTKEQEVFIDKEEGNKEIDVEAQVVTKIQPEQDTNTAVTEHTAAMMSEDEINDLRG